MLSVELLQASTTLVDLSLIKLPNPSLSSIDIPEHHVMLQTIFTYTM
jgi:hypothetical protein